MTFLMEQPVQMQGPKYISLFGADIRAESYQRKDTIVYHAST